jgi:ABC-type nitrate/sulfonate/bicarbonate transport system permease component
VSVLSRLLRPLANLLLSLVVVVGIWLAFLAVFAVDPLVAKSPVAVWHYLFGGTEAGAHRRLVLRALNQTLLDAGLGFVAGLAAALLVALAFVLARAVEQAMMPVAVVLRSVPLVAMTPLLTLIFGRGLMATTVIAGIVVFFPALVTMTFGLRSTSRQTVDLCRAYGARSWTVARKVMLPTAVPAIFASARVGLAGSLIGAMLAEWLATGKGLGEVMVQAPNTFDYDSLWASVVAMTTVSILAYNVIAAVEAVVAPRFTLRAGTPE